MIRYIFIFLLFALTLHEQNGFSYEVDTHQDITEHALKKSLSQRNFLSDLGYKDSSALITYTYPNDASYLSGMNSTVPRTILDWMRLGSEDEDSTFSEAVARYENHFYDPVNKVGYHYGVFSGYKAPDWALEDNVTYAAQMWSLQDAKNYYIAALTSSTKKDRDNNFAKTYKTLGHVLHLVEDMAQPQHTRNDSHGSGSQYEKQLKNTPPPDSVFVSAYEPVFDSYRGFYYTSDGKGMADFSNRNFVTAGTNFDCSQTGMLYCNGATGGGYPSPVLDAGQMYEKDIKDLSPGTPLEGKITFFGNTFTDNYSGETIQNEMMTTYSIFDKDLKNNNKPPAFTLNKYNYGTMANILIPRAVGYSAGLLNYFFRGELDMYEDPDVPGTYIIENKSDEDMKSSTDSTEGTFSLYYDDSNGNRYEVKDWSLYNQKVDIKAHSDLKGITVTPSYPEPKDKKYVLVFKGTLGQESNAVAGKIVSLIPVGPHIKITEVTGRKNSSGGHDYTVTFSLKGDKSTDVHVMNNLNSENSSYTFSQPVVRDLDYNTESHWYGNLAFNLLMRWNLSSGSKIDSFNDGITNTLVIDYNLTALPRAQKTYSIWDQYKIQTSSDYCTESGDVYGALVTEKTFFSLGRADWFVGQPVSIWGAGKWDKKLVSAFGYTDEELTQLPPPGSSFSEGETYHNYYGKVTVRNAKRDVQIGAYMRNDCTGQYTEQLFDSLPYPEVGTSNEVIYEIINNNSKLNSWMLKLIAE